MVEKVIALALNRKPEDFARMAEISDGLKVKLLLSINDHPEIRRLFKAFTIQRISTKCGSMNSLHWSRGAVRQEL